MGIKGLLSFIKSSGKIVNIQTNTVGDVGERQNIEKGLRIAIDISYFMYRWGVEDVNKYLRFVRQLESHGHRILFVFDGRPNKYKEKVIETRRSIIEKASANASSLQEVLASSEAEHFSEEHKWVLQKTIYIDSKRGTRPTKEQRQALKCKFYENKIHMLKSTEEADELLVSLQNNGHIDIIISGDTDLIRLGTERLWVPTDCDAMGVSKFLEFGLTRILKTMNMTLMQFQDMCILTGGVPQIGNVQKEIEIKKAWSLIRIYGSIKGLIEKHPDMWPCEKGFLDKSRSILEETEKFLDNLHHWVREDERDRLDAWQQGAQPPYTF